MAKRPSHREILGKLRVAKKAVEENRVSVVTGTQDALIFDAIDLGYDIETELIPILLTLLDQTEPEHYAGSRPPQKSYKGEITGLEIFPFKMKTDRFDCEIYYKFAMFHGDVWLISLHRDR